MLRTRAAGRVFACSSLSSASQETTMSMTFCQLPMSRITTATMASNEAHFLPQALPHNVRLLRRAHDPDRTRFVMSGRLSDVCAALEQLAEQEQRNVCL
jgi:hypothetical protein